MAFEFSIMLGAICFCPFLHKTTESLKQKEADLARYLLPSSSHPPSSCSSCPPYLSPPSPSFMRQVCWPARPHIGCVAMVDLELLILLFPLSPECWKYTHTTMCGLQKTEFLMARDKGHCLFEFSLKLQWHLYMYLNTFKFLLKCANCTYWWRPLLMVPFAEMPGELYTRMGVMWHPHRIAEGSHQIQSPWFTPPQSLVMPS